MTAFSTPKLDGNGVASVQMALEADSPKVSGTIREILARQSYGPLEATPFYVSLNAVDAAGKPIGVAGFMEGVHHKTPLPCGGALSFCRQVVYLHTLYVEDKYRKCGIATSALEHLPMLVDSEMGGAVNAMALSPVPQIKNNDGAVTQMQLGEDFFAFYIRLIEFYQKRGFQFSASMSYMTKRIRL